MQFLNVAMKLQSLKDFNSKNDVFKFKTYIFLLHFLNNASF